MDLNLAPSSQTDVQLLQNPGKHRLTLLRTD